MCCGWRCAVPAADIVADYILDANGSELVATCLAIHRTDITALRALLSLMTVLRTGAPRLVTQAHFLPLFGLSVSVQTFCFLLEHLASRCPIAGLALAERNALFFMKRGVDALLIDIQVRTLWLLQVVHRLVHVVALLSSCF